MNIIFKTNNLQCKIIYVKKLFFIATFLLPFLTIAQRQLTPKQQAKAKKAQEQKDKLNKIRDLIIVISLINITTH